MKIRKGFVSNSSSSSFIIDGNKYTCVDIALQMSKILYAENEEMPDGSNQSDNLEIIKKNLEKLENKNIPIFIQCCDDILIVKVEDKIYVEGSYHYEWDLDYIKSGEECEYSEMMEDAKFYFPLYDNKFFGKLVDSSTNHKYNEKWIYSCKKCGCRYIELEDGTIFCPDCLTDPDNNIVQKLFREDKLNRVLKNED